LKRDGARDLGGVGSVLGNRLGFLDVSWFSFKHRTRFTMHDIAAENAVRDNTYTVPRRFGIGTLLIASTVAAALAAIGKGLNAAPIQVASWGLFLLLVAIAQMIGERMPRASSTLVGALSAALILTDPLGLHWAPHLAHPFQAVTFLLFGGLVGYVVGTLLAAVYLLHDLGSSCLARLMTLQRRGL
jgi:hypothetical protein